jgi:hypothetical protein
MGSPRPFGNAGSTTRSIRSAKNLDAKSSRGDVKLLVERPKRHPLTLGEFKIACVVKAETEPI